MSLLRAFTQNEGDVYKKIIDISTQEKRSKKSYVSIEIQVPDRFREKNSDVLER